MNHRKVFKFMSTGVTVLGIALCIPATLLAQDTAPAADSQSAAGPPPEQGAMPMRRGGMRSPKQQLQQLTQMLNLSPDQQQRMMPILRDQRNKMKAIQSDSSLAPADRRQQIQSSRMDTNQKLEAIMTDSQKQQFEQAMQNRRGRMRRGVRGQDMNQGGGAGAPPPPGEQAPPPPGEQAPPPQ